MKSESTVARPVEAPPEGALAPSQPAVLLHERLHFSVPFVPPASNRIRALHEWRMEENDSPILRYLYRHVRPRRHLEFGTWEGRGTLDCLQECDAAVWSINLRHGETNEQGRWAYDAWLDDYATPRHDHAPHADHAHDDADYAHDEALRFVGCLPHSASLATRTARNGRTVVRTDAMGAIGRLVHEAGLGHRLCQIYCDSRQWDATSLPDGFFDSVLIDGGHSAEVVASDTRHSLRLVHSGGLILWHDYCPDAEAQAGCPSIRGVLDAMSQLAPTIRRYCADWFWIEPSWLLVGVRNDRTFDIRAAEVG